MTDGGLLAATGGAHPTMWVGLWFERDGRPHQRGCTLVDPDPGAGTFSLEFALQDGTASDWERAARPGDTIDATLQGTRFSLPEPRPARLFVIGDAASLPAVNSLLDALPGTPRRSGTRRPMSLTRSCRSAWIRPATPCTRSRAATRAHIWWTR